MMYIHWNRLDKQAKVVNTNTGNWALPVSCLVRNELNGWRPNPNRPIESEQVFAITKANIQTDKLVMPREFPVGIWRITRIEPRKDFYRKPFFIFTDAHQSLEIWEAGYKHKTGEVIQDWIYGLHCSGSDTTQGCIKIQKEEDLLRLVKELSLELEAGFYPTLEIAER